MSANIAELKRTLAERRGKLDYLMRERDRVRVLRERAGAARVDAEEAQRIIQHVAQLTQQQLEYHVSELVTLALAAVFPDPYALRLEFKLKRGQSEAHLQLARGGLLLGNPTAESGGGVVDVVAFALRVSLWSLAHPRTRPTLVLDEPLRFLSRDLQAKAAAMIRELSRRLGLQFLVVTHEQSLLGAADKVFRVTIQGGVSQITEEGAE